MVLLGFMIFVVVLKCREIKNKCRIRIQGQALWVEGQGGIYRPQFLKYRYDWDGDEFYNYVTDKDKKNYTHNNI